MKAETVKYWSYVDKEWKTTTPKYFYCVLHTPMGMMIMRLPNPTPAWRRLVLPAITRLMNSFGYTRSKGLSSMHSQDFFETRIDEAFDGTYDGFEKFYLVAWENNELKVIRNPLNIPQSVNSSA